MSRSNAIQVAAAVIEYKGRYLITKRADDVHLAGYWEFPGGKREFGESLETCLVRELREELRVEIKGPVRFMVIQHEYPDKTVELNFFFCSWVPGEIRLFGCADFRWVYPGELSGFTFLPADEPVVAELQERAKVM
jgi:mutator protein MutT